MTGPMLQEEALKIGKIWGEKDFKASNGWLSNFKKRHNIAQFVVRGESAEVREVVAAWYDRLQSLFGSYKATQIWNADETACFYRALPDKTLATKGRACKGGRKAKDRLTNLARAVDVLTAICWIRRIKQAWNDVKPRTIVNCFAHCGAVPIEDDTVDPFADLLEEESEQSPALQTLVSQNDPTLFGMEYFRSGDEVATCATIDESDWRKSLLSVAVEKITTKKIRSDDEQINDEDSYDEVEIEKMRHHFL